MLTYHLTPMMLAHILAYFTENCIFLQHGWRLTPTHCQRLSDRLGAPAPDCQHAADHRPLAHALTVLLATDLLHVVNDCLQPSGQHLIWLRADQPTQIDTLCAALESAERWQQSQSLLRLESTTSASDRLFVQQQLRRYQRETETRPRQPIIILAEPNRWALHLSTACHPHLYYHLLLLCDWVTNRLLHLTPLSLHAALTHHMSQASAEAYLGQAQGTLLTETQRSTLTAWAQRSHFYQLQHTILLQTQQQSQLDALMARRGLRKHITKRLGPTLAAATPQLGRPLRRWLANQHIPLTLSTDHAKPAPAADTAESYKALVIMRELTKQYQLPHLLPQHALSQVGSQLDPTKRNQLDQQAAAALAALRYAIQGYEHETDSVPDTSAITQQIEQALATSDEIQIRYQGQHDERPRWRTVEPHWIEERGNVSYLHAYCHAAADGRVFRLDRIQQLRIA